MVTVNWSKNRPCHNLGQLQSYPIFGLVTKEGNIKLSPLTDVDIWVVMDGAGYIFCYLYKDSMSK